ncbi:MAG: hypothetical protein A49_08440 [Methyloceanibacter sp.]|nr:MAG: hypothetical protein A49_08440 [Methyloceanibacter sp.]
MAVVEELVALLGYELEGEGNLKRFTAGLDKAEKSARGNAVQLGRLDGASRKGARSVGRFGVVAGKTSTLLKGLGAAAVGTFAADSFKDFASFDRRMTLIGINAEASAEQTANAAERVRGLANRFAAPINDAVTGLETLVASGKSLDEALAFLPSVLMVSTATASATEDVANTALKTADALKLSAKDVAYMFDIMVTSGKDGQFELRDMAQYLPVVANMFAAAGYEGLPGLKALVSYLQTLREDSGSAGQAITQFTNILSKLESPRTLKTFEDHGIDLRKELEAARASGGRRNPGRPAPDRHRVERGITRSLQTCSKTPRSGKVGCLCSQAPKPTRNSALQ